MTMMMGKIVTNNNNADDNGNSNDANEERAYIMTMMSIVRARPAVQ